MLLPSSVNLDYSRTLLEQNIVKLREQCGVWPRKWGSVYCGARSCNKMDFPLAGY